MGWEASNQDLNSFVDFAATALLILAAVAASGGIAQIKCRVCWFCFCGVVVVCLFWFFVVLWVFLVVCVVFCCCCLFFVVFWVFLVFCFFFLSSGALAWRERYLNLLNTYFLFQGFLEFLQRFSVKFSQSKGKTISTSQMDWESAWPQLCCGSRLCLLLPGVRRVLI